MKDKEKVFELELSSIQDEDIRNKTKDLIGKLPDYFFEVAASSTGKYHPNYALGEGGLVRHTKAAVKIAVELFNLEMFRGLLEKKDLIIAALILHDGLKHGEQGGQWVKADHPVIMANFVMNELQCSDLAYDLAELIETHMGQWNTDYKTKAEIMKKPTTKAQSFVHLCDYLASRKFLEVNFEA